MVLATLWHLKPVDLQIEPVVSVGSDEEPCPKIAAGKPLGEMLGDHSVEEMR